MTKNSSFLEILNTYLTLYLPNAVGVSPNTIISYKTTFRLLVQFIFQSRSIPADRITFEMLDYQLLMDFLSWIETERKCCAATKNLRLAALASFSSYAQNRDLDAATAFRCSVNKIPYKRCINNKRAVMSREEVTILLALPNDHYVTGKRDKVMLMLMYATGARAQEVCDLTVGDIEFKQNGAIVKIVGKGQKRRRIAIPPACADAVKKYIQHRGIAALPKRHVFSSKTHEKMTVSCIEEVFKKYISIAKTQHPDMFSEKSYPPHSMRHTTACHLLESGVSLMVIKNFLGHSSIMTTQIYAELSQATIDRNLKEWNEKWFDEKNFEEHNEEANRMPVFLMP